MKKFILFITLCIVLIKLSKSDSVHYEVTAKQMTATKKELFKLLKPVQMKTFILFIIFVVLWTICYSATTYIVAVILDISWYESRTMGPSYTFLNGVCIIIAGQSTKEFKDSALLVRL